MRMKFLILSVVLLISIVGFSQSVIVDNPSITINKDAQLDTLIQLQQKVLEKNKKLEGWRIQIFFEGGNKSYQKALAQKSTFVTKYPEFPVYLTFSAPYYKVRVGDFRSRTDAEILLKKLKKDYSNAFLIKTEINFPPL